MNMIRKMNQALRDVHLTPLQLKKKQFDVAFDVRKTSGILRSWPLMGSPKRRKIADKFLPREIVGFLRGLRDLRGEGNLAGSLFISNIAERAVGSRYIHLTLFYKLQIDTIFPRTLNRK